MAKNDRFTTTVHRAEPSWGRQVRNFLRRPSAAPSRMWWLLTWYALLATLGAVAASLLAAGCASMNPWGPRPLRPPEITRALEIAGRIYGEDLARDVRGEPRLDVLFIEPNCTVADGRPGYVTFKGNCVRGAIAPWSPQMNVAGRRGMRLADSGFCLAAWEAWEIGRLRAPRDVSPGEAEMIARCESALADAGL